MVTEITLPHWLDSLIFDELHAEYRQVPDEVVTGADQGYEHVNTYLGTYFPRSYAEAFGIFTRLFENEGFKSKWADKDQVNIFDFCCGTGGEILGLIAAILDSFPSVVQINVDAHDANPYSIRKILRIKERLLELFPKVNIFIHLIPRYVNDEVDIKDILGLTQPKHDIVMSFKAINEFIQCQIFTEGNSYNNVLRYLTSRLSDDGILCLLDLTHRQSASTQWYPEIMNAGINAFVRRNNDFKTIVPAACYDFEDTCSGCYMQALFKVTHSKRNRDNSKVVFRIIAKRPFAEIVMSHTRQNTPCCRVTNSSCDKSAPYLDF